MRLQPTLAILDANQQKFARIGEACAFVGAPKQAIDERMRKRLSPFVRNSRENALIKRRITELLHARVRFWLGVTHPDRS